MLAIIFEKIQSWQGGSFLLAVFIFACLGLFIWLVRQAIKLVEVSQKEGISAEVRVSKYFFYKSDAPNSELAQQQLQDEVDRLQEELAILAEAYVTPFGRALQKLRRIRKLRLDIMARRMRMTPSQLSELETAKRHVTAEIVEAVVKEFNISGHDAVELRDLARISNKEELLLSGRSSSVERKGHS